MRVQNICHWCNSIKCVCSRGSCQ